nr:MAG TPA: hypothetical protein [Caudoviricetes sp.]
MYVPTNDLLSITPLAAQSKRGGSRKAASSFF